jgi:DNA processing protein
VVISTCGPGDDTYPAGLLDLETQPLLHHIGTLPSTPGVAVVGTRRCTTYGSGLAEAFGVHIAAAGWSTISGLARGVDAAAHQGCLRRGGHAMAVLGSGVDVCYPRENRPLYDAILARGGAVVSEYPPGTPPDRWRFPARNLLIAAIAQAVVVVEAAEKGGALITARLAAEIGRPVFVVPGDVDRSASVGCNRLIKDGAHPVLGADDLIAELELVVGPRANRGAVGGEKVPIAGADIETLAHMWGMGVPEALIEVGRLELAGEVRRSGDVIFPA